MNILSELRPKTIEEFICNKKTLEAIKEIIENPKGRAILLKGNSGVGKTSVARVFALYRSINIDDNNDAFVEINCADRRGINDMDVLIREIENTPLFSSTKIIVLDEAHQLTVDAQNKLLKPLEDFSNDTYVFLCSTNPSKIIETIRNRCVEIDLSIKEYDEVFEKSLASLIIREAKLLNFEYNDEVVRNIVNNVKNQQNFSARKLVLQLSSLFSSFANNKLLDYSIINFSQDEIETSDFFRFLCNGFIKHNFEEALLHKAILSAQELLNSPETSRISILSYFAKVCNNKASVNLIRYYLLILDSFTINGSFDSIDGKQKFLLSIRYLFDNYNSKFLKIRKEIEND